MAILQTSPLPPAGADATWHTLPGVEATRALHVDRRAGLGSGEAATRRAEFGPNRLAEARSETPWRAFARAYRAPVPAVLVAASIASFVLDDPGTGLALLALTVVEAILALRWDGEPGAGQAAPGRLLPLRARVRRDGELRVLAADQIVPGDVVRVQAGDVVPADGRLLESTALEVDESALTGESVTAAKVVDALDDPEAPLADRTDMVYMATAVTHGSGELVVTATGAATEAGRIYDLLRHAVRPAGPLSRQLAQLTSRIVAIAGGALFLAVAFALVRGEAARTVLASAVAVSVAAMPTGLPAVLIAVLERGRTALAHAGARVKRLETVATLGAVTAINAGATRTLTLGVPAAVEVLLAGRRYRVPPAGAGPSAPLRRVAGEPSAELEPLALPLALTTDAVLPGPEPSLDATGAALAALAEKAGVDVALTRIRCPRLAEVPYDAAYGLRATFHRVPYGPGGETVRCLARGAPDQLLGRATTVLGMGERPLHLGDEARARYLAETARLAREGLRVVATAWRDVHPRSLARRDGDLLPLVDGLTLLALVGLADPPQPGAREAVARARAGGLQVRLLTGDRPIVAAGVAGRLHIAGRTVAGADFASLAHADAAAAIDRIGVVARAAPAHKLRLVETLRRRGDVVAMTGDGVDDAPALAAAHVGIAAERAGAASRRAAAIVVAEDDLPAIVRAVELGRSAQRDVIRSLRFALGSLAGLVSTVVGGAALSVAGGVPFLPLEVLYLTFATQVTQASALTTAGAAAEATRRPPAHGVREPIADPHEWRRIGAIGLLQAAATLAVMAAAEGRHGEATARTMGLVAFGLMTLLLSFAHRRAPANRAFLLVSGASLAAIVLAAESGTLNRILSTTGLDLGQWLLCAAAALAVAVTSAIRESLRRRPATADSNGGPSC